MVLRAGGNFQNVFSLLSSNPNKESSTVLNGKSPCFEAIYINENSRPYVRVIVKLKCRGSNIINLSVILVLSYV